MNLLVMPNYPVTLVVALTALWLATVILVTILYGQRRKHRRAGERLSLLTGALERMREMIFLIDAKGHIRYVNQESCRRLGYRPDELLGMPLELIDPDMPAEAFDKANARFLAADSAIPNLESRHRRRDGSIFPVDVSVALFAHEGEKLCLAVVRDTTKRQRAEQRLRESYALLQSLSARRDSAREEEKTRIAREIHDELGQQLTALRMELSTVGIELELAQEPSALRERIRYLTDVADEALWTVRNMAMALRPLVLDAGLARATEWLAEQFERQTGVACTLHLATPLPVFNDYQATALFRIIQESLTNIARHAKARRVDVSLLPAADACELIISDDGCGFIAGTTRQGSYGLIGMHERALMLRGNLLIDSSPGNGTVIKVTVPLDNA